MACSVAKHLAIDACRVGVQRGRDWILNEITWQVPAGACVAILGPNGSGKSTLTRLLAGHLFPTRGQLQVVGRRFGESDLNELRKRVRLVQPAGPYDAEGELSALEVVLTGLFGTINLYDNSTLTQRNRALELLNRVGLGPVSDHRYATLSSGEKVRCLIARALIEPPELLLLDEPTAGLDLLAREQVLATVQILHQIHPNSTVALITHHVEELSPQIDQVLLLDQGRVAACGSMQDVLRDEVLSGVYRCPLNTVWQDGRCYTRVRPGAWNGLLG